MYFICGGILMCTCVKSIWKRGVGENGRDANTLGNSFLRRWKWIQNRNAIIRQNEKRKGWNKNGDNLNYVFLWDTIEIVL